MAPQASRPTTQPIYPLRIRAPRRGSGLAVSETARSELSAEGSRSGDDVTGTPNCCSPMATQQLNVAPPIAFGDTTRADPPMSDASPRTMERPRPVPPKRRDIVESAC